MENPVPHSSHIILADDDPDHAILFRIILGQVDPSKTLLVARNGRELLDLLKDLVPEMLFLDLRMPCKNGLECLSEIRNNPSLSNLPVVVYSGSWHMSDI